MLLEIANEDRVITITADPAFPVAIIGSPLIATYNSTWSLKNKINNKKTLLELSWTMPPNSCNRDGLGQVNMTGGSGLITSKACLKVKAEGNFPILKNDFGYCSCIFYWIWPFPVGSGHCKFTITNAGQNKVKAQ